MSCCAKSHNQKNKADNIIKNCDYCNKEFISTTKKRAPKFCSKSCASKGSVTEKTIQNALKNRKKYPERFYKNMDAISKSLYTREKHKYIELENKLNKRKLQYEFEFCIENYVYDLAIIDKRIIFEFDGAGHNKCSVSKKDKVKEKLAKENGWFVQRIKVQPKEIIAFEKILNYIDF